MQLGMIGLGRMGANMTTRLLGDSHEVVVYDRSPEAVARSAAEGATAAASLAELVAKLTPPRAIWIMVPAGKPTDDTIHDLLGRLAPGDTIIDGGNSNFRESQARAKRGVGAQERLLSDGRRRSGRRQTGRADLPLARAQGRLRIRRGVGRGPLLEDGP
jgi:6-phosphogluconate dehydrogenase (decarboxylating)